MHCRQGTEWTFLSDGIPHASVMIRFHRRPRAEVSSRGKGGALSPAPDKGQWAGLSAQRAGLGHLLLGLGCWTQGKVPEEIYSAALLRVDHPSQGCVCKSSGLLIGLSG